MPARNRRLADDAFFASLETIDLYLHTVMNGRFGGTRKSKALGGTAEFADYRDYQPGDDLRRIDWNLAARTDQFFVKQFLDERQHEHHIYLDLSASMDGPRGEKGLCALRLAAAFGYLAVRSMDRVCFRLLRGSACEELCPPITGRASYFASLELLSDVSFGGDCDLAAALMNDAAPGWDNGLSVIVSDFQTDSPWKKAVAALQLRKREVALVRLLESGERDPAYYGPLALKDAECPDGGGYRLEVDREAIRAYRAALDEWTDNIQTWCRSHGVLFLDAAADMPVEDIVLLEGFAANLIH